MSRNFEIAGIKILIEDRGRDRLFARRPGLDFEGFLSKGTPDFVIAVKDRHFEDIDKRKISIDFEEGVGIRFDEQKNGFLFSLESPCALKVGYMNTKERIAWFNSYSENLDVQFFHPFIRSCLQIFLLQKQGFMLHACGINDAGRGYLFVGPSGSGKSTLASKSKGFLLSDEWMCVRQDNKKYCIYATPWNGKGGFAELKKIFFLQKAQKLSFQKISHSQNFSMLLANTFVSNCSSPMMKALISALSNMASKVPSYILSFALNSPVWEQIHQLERQSQ